MGVLYPREFKLRAQMGKIVIFALIALFVLSWTRYSRNGGSPLSSFQTQSINPVNNETFGFEKIFVLTLPGREDRLVPLIDAANATKMSFTNLAAVRDDEIPLSDRPKGWKNDHPLGVLGCLTSHVRAWQKIVAENIATAIVMESDADWDMRIHQSMESLAPGVRKIADFPFDKNINKVNAREQPYGDGWDLIWLGHCGMNAVGNTRQYSFDDPSTQPARFEFKIWDSFNNYQHPVGTRAVFQVHAGVCSTGYAVSQAGARKLIKHFKEVDNPIDLKLSNICKEAYDMMCVGVYPMIISNCDSASNIEDVDSLDDWKAHQAAANKKGPARNPGHSIQISARVNAPMVLDHNAGPEEWRYQYDGVWVAGPDGVRYQVPANTTGTKDLPADKRVAN